MLNTHYYGFFQIPVTESIPRRQHTAYINGSNIIGA